MRKCLQEDVQESSSVWDRCPYGALRAIAGLAAGLPAIQQKFCDTKDVCHLVVRLLAMEMEDKKVAQWGCAAIVALGKHHVGNSDQLKGACPILTEILQLYMKSSPEVVHECLKAISSLSHSHLANRSRFGSAGACQMVIDASKLYVQNQKIALQCTRVIADLAGNHSQNQARLEAHG